MRAVLNKMIAAFAAIGILTTGLMSWVVFSANPGTDQDPLVTMSYVEKRVEEVLKSVNGDIADIKKQVAAMDTNASNGSDTSSGDKGSNSNDDNSNSGTVSAAATFQVVQIKKGSFVYLGGGSEFIIRSGRVSAITSDTGGLSDLTGGKDIAMYQSIPSNHHILVPRDDGRGFAAQEDCYVMIKGPYTVAAN